MIDVNNRFVSVLIINVQYHVRIHNLISDINGRIEDKNHG